MKRPDMRARFRAQIDTHVNGGGWNRTPNLPHGVAKVKGDVTDREIVVTMKDGTEWKWAGGKYASRKVNLCYAPLMPKPVQ